MFYCYFNNYFIKLIITLISLLKTLEIGMKAGQSAVVHIVMSWCISFS